MTSKSLLILEVVVCLGPMAVLLLLGLLVLPFQVLVLFSGEVEEYSFEGILFVACGMAGLLALSQVLSYLFDPNSKRLPGWLVLLLALSATFPIFDILTSSAGAVWIMLALMAIACSVHLIWLARDYVFWGWFRPLSGSGK